uniref:Uncharacterized protein n=1 Tax=Globodera rostochiensis TaxID=31243 RepID=A0A914HX30_GLORO
MQNPTSGRPLTTSDFFPNNGGLDGWGEGVRQPSHFPLLFPSLRRQQSRRWEAIVECGVAATALPQGEGMAGGDKESIGRSASPLLSYKPNQDQASHSPHPTLPLSPPLPPIAAAVPCPSPHLISTHCSPPTNSSQYLSTI